MSKPASRTEAEQKIGPERMILINQARSAFCQVLSILDAHLLVVAICVHESQEDDEHAVTIVSGEKDNLELYNDLVEVFKKHSNQEEEGGTIH